MSQRILRHLPLVLALAATLWVVWIGVRIWTMPGFAEMSPLGYLPLAIPAILVAGAAVIASLRAPGCLAGVVVLFLGYIFITGFSIGTAYYGPAVVLLTAVLADTVLFWIERRRLAAA